jgi:hypothetical protein
VQKSTGTGTCTWLEVQKLAAEDDPESDKILTQKVLEAQHISVRLPIVRTAVKDSTVKCNGKFQKVEKGEVVICDIVRKLPAISISTILMK